MIPPLRGVLSGAGLLFLFTDPTCAQGLSADLYAGGTSYDVLAEQVSATNLIANLRYQSASSRLLYVSLAAPLDQTAVLWSAAGASARVSPFRGRVWSLGSDFSIQGYAYRDSQADVTGAGATALPLAFLNVARGALALEARAGSHMHFFSLADSTGSRALMELGLRGTITTGGLLTQADLRWLNAREASYPYLGVQSTTSRGAGRAWGWVGKWFASEMDAVDWGVGGGLALGSLGEVWLSVRQDAGDPLVLSGERRTWNIGFSRTLGAPRPRLDDLGPRIEGGRTRIRLPERELSGSVVPSVAGEFSEWKATAMRREGAEWVLDLALAPGVYRFAFIRDGGEWFVPEGYPGRIDDGMGGHVAILVVP